MENELQELLNELSCQYRQSRDELQNTTKEIESLRDELERERDTITHKDYLEKMVLIDGLEFVLIQEGAYIKGLFDARELVMDKLYGKEGE